MGLVLTNNHVVNGASAVSATDIGNGQTYSATVLGYDRDQDVALLQLNGASALVTARLGDSSRATVGEALVAIGNAGGGGPPREWRLARRARINRSLRATSMTPPPSTSVA